MLAILGTCIKSEKFSTGKRCMWIHRSGRHIDHLGTVSSRIVAGWGRCRAGQRCRWLSAWGRWRCTCCFASPACLQILRGAMLARQESGHVGLTEHRRVSCYRSLHQFMPQELNSRFLSSRTSVRGFMIRYFASSIAAHKNASLAILGIFNARRMSDCASCTQPPCLATVAAILKTYKKLAAASNNEIRLLPLPYTLP